MVDVFAGYGGSMDMVEEKYSIFILVKIRNKKKCRN